MMYYPRVSLYALMLATAGIPLYIHLPRFASVELGMSLGLLGAILLTIRVFDFVQDPFLGALADRFPHWQSRLAMGAALALAIGFPVLFALGPGQIGALILVLMLLFTGYSLGSILLYGRAQSLLLHPSHQMRLATWREAGQITGIILAAALPAVLNWQAFGWTLALIALVALWVTRPVWSRPAIAGDHLSLTALNRAGATRVLALMVLNSLPVALTSTLFLFFAQDYLGLGQRAGLFLLAFFAAAGLAIPIWAALARRIGARRTLLIAMALAMLSFTGAAFLNPGAALPFLLICIASGIATGADILLLPMMFSRALIASGLRASSAFGYWSLASKLALALAAATALPLLDLYGFAPDKPLTDNAKTALITAYAILPCLLKTLAFGYALTLPHKEKPQ
jgi:Na+/melibiose symporter-like transporter